MPEHFDLESNKGLTGGARRGHLLAMVLGGLSLVYVLITPVAVVYAGVFCLTAWGMRRKHAGPP
jgi:hypothetical protein